MKTKRRIRVLVLAAALLFLLSCSAIAAPQEEGQVLRVGFPQQKGLSEWAEDGSLSGYTYDYLREIAQYTGWNYEFVAPGGDADDGTESLLEMLARGELDLVGGMEYTERMGERFDYSSVSYGAAGSALVVLEENRAVTENNYQYVSGLRIGIVEGEELCNEDLRQFCRLNRMEPELIHCATKRDQRDKLDRGEVDAILRSEIGLDESQRVVARLTPRPFYFVTAKGNSDVLSQLNTALLMIRDCDPNLGSRLSETYFGGGERGLFLSEADEAYIRQAGTLYVVYAANEPPLQYQNDQGEFAGVVRTIFDYIQAHTGLRFTYLPAENTQEAAGMLADGTADLIASVVLEQASADWYHVALTRSFLSSQLTLVINNEADPQQLAGKRLALVKDYPYFGPFLGEVLYFESREACIRAVSEGEADYTYGNMYTVQYHIKQGDYRNIQVVPQSGLDRAYAIGVGRPADSNLLLILNKALRSIPIETIQAMIYQNAFQAPTYSLGSYLSSNPTTAALLFGVPALIFLALLLCFSLNMVRFNRRIAAENQRYLQLCTLSGECLFEYDFPRDRLTLAEQSAKVFGTEQVNEHYRRTLESTGTGPLGKKFSDLLEEGESGEELLIHMPDGGQRWFRVVRKTTWDGFGKPLYQVGKLVDIQSEREKRQDLEKRAQRDSLTGVYNAACCRQMVSDLLEKGCGGALLILDIDWFKRVNDEHGHYTGDQVLIGVAELLSSRFRQQDIVGRPGGDEFLVYMPRVQDRAIVEEKCRDLLIRCTSLSGRAAGVPVTLSIGVAMAGEERAFEPLYRRADTALYTVKNRGRNGFEIV